MSSGSLMAPGVRGGALAEAAASREVAEVQAAMMLAKRFPRDEKQSLDRILVACQREGLAAAATYQYARGGTDITGPSIRLAETLARCWGNIHFGLREVEQRDGESTVEAYAIDLETNTRAQRVFQAKHIRSKRNGNEDLHDPRDIYELVANQGSRRTRACILALIPGDIIDAAVDECAKTLTTKVQLTPELVKKMVQAFVVLEVEKEQIEKRIQRKLEAITPAQFASLRKIYNSIKDGMSTADDWFEAIPADEPPEQADTADKILSKSKSKRTKGEPKAVVDHPQVETAESKFDDGLRIGAPIVDDGVPTPLEQWGNIIKDLAPSDGAKMDELRNARKSLAGLSDDIEVNKLLTGTDKKALHAQIMKMCESIDDKTGGY